MAYLGTDYSISHLVRKDLDDEPTDDLRWTLGTPTKRWLGIHSQNFYGNLQGSAAAASKWDAPITITVDGDASGNVTFDGSANQTLTLTVADDSHNHTKSTIVNFNEEVQDVVGEMVLGNTESGIAVSYDDVLGKLNFDVSDFTISINGDVSGTINVTNLGNTSATFTVADDSHTHDGRYYTETEADSRFINNTGDTMTGNLVMSGSTITGLTATPTDNTEATSKAYVDAGLSAIGGSGGGSLDDKVNKAGDTMSGALNMGANKITGLANPSAGTDALNVQYADARYINSSGNETLSGSLIVTGDLTVNGTTTTVNSNTVNIGDNIIVLNSDEAGTPSQDGGIEIERGTEANVQFVWDETNDMWSTVGQKLGNIADPTDGSHVGDRAYNDSRYVNLTGDTMSGNLTLNDGTNGIQMSVSTGGIELYKNGGGAFIDFKDSGAEDYDVRLIASGSTLDIIASTGVDLNMATLYGVADPIIGSQVGDRDYNDARYVRQNAGALVGDLSAGNNRITNVATPVDAGDAANKGYVDNNFVSKSGDTITGNLAVTGTFQATGMSYPIADGNTGEVITTDGFGNLTFAAISALSGGGGDGGILQTFNIDDDGNLVHDFYVGDVDLELLNYDMDFVGGGSFFINPQGRLVFSF